MSINYVESANTEQRRLFTFSSPLRYEQELYLLRFTGREAISELFRFHLELCARDARIELKSMIGQPVTLGITLADNSVRYISAYVADFVHTGTDTNAAYYHAELVPWLWLLSRRQDSRIFQDQTTEDIVKAVFSRYGTLADHEFRLRTALEPLSYCTQYQESDLAFVLRLLENEGLFFTFQHSRGSHRMVIADDSSRLEPLATQPKIRYHQASSPESEDSITTWAAARRLQPTHLSLKSFDYKQPGNPHHVLLRSVNEQGNADNLELYEYEGTYGYATLEEGERKARHRLEAMEVQSKLFSGKSNCRAMEPGRTFELLEHYDHDFGPVEDRHFLLLAVDHWGQNNYGHQSQASYRNDFTCVRRKMVFRPGLRTPKGVVSGPQTAIVVGPPGEEIFTDELGRVKVQFHWDRMGTFCERSSCWVRVAQSAASGGFGSIQIPRVGDEVVVVFLDGNPDRPLVMGSLYNASNQPPWALPANKTQSGVLTRSVKGNGQTANFLRFEDKLGAEQISLHAERNMEVEVEADESHCVGGNRAVTIHGSHCETVKRDASVRVLNGGYSVAVEQGAITLSAASSITLEAGASKLVLQANGTVHLSGIEVHVDGSSAVHLNK